MSTSGENPASKSEFITTAAEGFTFQVGKGVVGTAPPGAIYVRRGLEELMRTLNSLIDDSRVANQRRHEQVESLQSDLHQELATRFAAIHSAIAESPARPEDSQQLREALAQLGHIREELGAVHPLRQQSDQIAEAVVRIQGVTSAIEASLVRIGEQTSANEGATKQTHADLGDMKAQLDAFRQQATAIEEATRQTQAQLGALQRQIGEGQTQSAAILEKADRHRESLGTLVQQVTDLQQHSDLVEQSMRDSGERAAGLSESIEKLREQSASTEATANQAAAQLLKVECTLAELQSQSNASAQTQAALTAKLAQLDDALGRIRAIHDTFEGFSRQNEALNSRIAAMESAVSEAQRSLVSEREAFQSVQATVAELRRDQWQFETSSTERQDVARQLLEQNQRSVRRLTWLIGASVVGTIAVLLILLLR